MGSIKLLLIDDNEDNRILVKITLENSTNWTIVTASSGVEGMLKAESELPDVILLDLILSDLDGLIVYKLLKNNLFTDTIPVIFMTAMVNPQVMTRLQKTNARGIITKPFDTVSLASNIAKMCGWDFFSNRKKNKLEICNPKSKSKSIFITPCATFLKLLILLGFKNTKLSEIF